MLSRFRFSGWFLLAVLVLTLSDRVDAARFGPAAPLVRLLQDLGGQLALAADPLIRSALGQLHGTGLPVSPALLLGGGVAIVLDLVRARARRERARD